LSSPTHRSSRRRIEHAFACPSDDIQCQLIAGTTNRSTDKAHSRYRKVAGNLQDTSSTRSSYKPWQTFELPVDAAYKGISLTFGETSMNSIADSYRIHNTIYYAE